MGWVECIRQRRLLLAGSELVSTDQKIITIALKYGYDSPDSLEGGYLMDYKIVEKESFMVIGASKVFKYDSATTEIPQFWTEHYQMGRGDIVCGMYGISIDESMGSDEFEYLIADDTIPSTEIPDGFVKKSIPKHTWAILLARVQCRHLCRM